MSARIAAVVCALGIATGLSSAAGQARPHGRLLPPQDLGLLEAPDRDRWQRPDRIMDALGIADASRVADVGVGSGCFTIRPARRVGISHLTLLTGKANAFPFLGPKAHEISHYGMMSRDTTPLGNCPSIDT